MNKVILMGRLTRNPEIRYSQSIEPVAVARYTIAVGRRFKREGEPDADFINVVAFGKQGEFAEKYFRKGQMISVVGRLQVRSWDDQSGQKRWATDVIVEEQYFAESKASFESHGSSNANNSASEEYPGGFYPIEDSLEDEDLPF